MSAFKTNILVVGSGLAGTLFALELAEKRPDLQITIISKKGKKHSSSYLAQGGIAAVLPETNDRIEQHIKDTFLAGANCNDIDVVEYFVSRAPEAINILEKWNISFDKDSSGSKNLALEGGHSVARVLHHKDYTGKHIMQQLHGHLNRFSNINLLEDVEIFDILQNEENTMVGANLWNSKKQESFSLNCDALLLCTGGIGSLYKYSTNPSTATGNGIALAEKAGAKIRDIINIQFHPTALWQENGSQLPLISEALRGAGAILRNTSGEAFMADIHPLKDLAPRDVVSRAIVKEIENQNLPYVFLDATSISHKEWENHFPGILSICFQAGIFPETDWIPVVPAAHYSCGGIETDTKGKTAVKGLYVLGETAATGLHGANRLASNSLLEATLMATASADELSKEKSIQGKPHIIPGNPGVYSGDESAVIAEKLLNDLREIMQEYCSVVKTTSGLEIAAAAIREIEDLACFQIPCNSFNLAGLLLSLSTARLIVENAIKAKENKGVFYKRDLLEEPAVTI